jgi:hypothetical protein
MLPPHADSATIASTAAKNVLACDIWPEGSGSTLLYSAGA